MKRTILSTLPIVSLLLALTVFAGGQVATGVPKFSSIGGGEFDTVNLGNLNVHFTVPVLHKAGRGIPFSFDIGYDSSIYQIVTVNGAQTWQPSSQAGSYGSYWGWQNLEVNTPYLNYTTAVTSSGTCYNNQQWYVLGYSNYLYYDAFGTAHPFPGVGGAQMMSPGGYGCPPPWARGQTTGTAGDGSGYSISFAVVGSSTGNITTSSGTTTSLPFLTSPPLGSSPYNATDANGNEITFSNGAFTDTLGTTALTVTGAQPNPMKFTYTGPAGSEFYQVNFSPYNIKTAFLCTNPTIQDYTSTGSVYLPSSIVLPDGSQYSLSYEPTPGNSSYTTGRVSQVTLPTGGVIQYSYTGSNDGINCADGSTLGLQRIVSPGGTWSYSRSGSGAAWTTTVSDPANNQTAISFEEYLNNFYETQRLAYTSGTLLSTDITCYNGQSIGTPANCYNTAITAQITRITNFRYVPDANGIQAETDSTYDIYGLIHEVDDYDYGTGAVGALIRKTITAYASLGNSIVDRPSSVTIEDSGSVIKAYTGYGYDETAVATPSGTTPQWISVTGSRGNLTSVNAQANGTVNLYRKYTYYNTGMLTTSTDVSTSSTTNGTSTTYHYNNTGTPSPSCGNSFVTSISEPVGSMSRSFSWDCNGGVLLSVTDENSKVSSTAYSGSNYTNVFWRPYSTTDNAGTTTNYFYYLTTATPPVEFQTESKYATAFNGGNSTVDKVTTNDGLGRAIFSQTKQGPSASNYDTVATCYDNFGRTNLTTLPYSAALATSTSTCPSSNPGTSYAYDAAGRTQTVSDSGGGSTSYTYTKNDTLKTRTSPTVSKQSESDALGRLTSVCEITSGTTLWPSASCSQKTTANGYLTSYTYDVLGNLTSVTQNNQASSGHQTRSYAYDMLSRLTSETNPETNNVAATYIYDSLTSDASCGTITSAGNLLKRLDAAGNALCSSGYDALHRVGAVTYPSSSTPAKHFVYDTATVNGTSMSNAKTRLAEAYTCTGTCSSKITDLGLSYFATGRQTDVWELTPHSGTNYYFHVTETPWPNGATNTISNLSGLPTITYGADGEGRASSASAASGQYPVTSVSYNAASQVTGLTYGSSDSDTFTFYPNTGRLHTYVFSMGASPNTKTDTGTLTWNTNGSLQQLVIADQINPLDTQTCNYTHDDLGRAASANCGTTVFNQNFAYDPFGNITKTVPTGSTGTAFQPSYDYTNYTNRMSSTPFTYNNNNGALTADSWHSYGWDTANRLTTVDSGASGVCATYDALDRVVEQDTGSACATSPTSSTEIVYSPSGAKLALMNGSTLRKAFVGLPGGAQAVYNSSGLLFYRHPDWLGSSRLATTPSRTCYWDAAYAPFGENYAAPSSGCVTQDLSFTGQNQDTEASSAGGAGGLYDFMFRRQSPVQGRWLSPDPLGLGAANPSDPQTWNRYAYVGNRPLNRTDALGLDDPCGPDGCPCDPFDPSCCDPSDPSCCDPFDPSCGPPPPPPPPPPGPPPPGGGAPPGPHQHTGAWPNNETLGLPMISNTSPLDESNLFSLLPGLNCGGDAPVTTGFLGTGTPTGSSGGPCLLAATSIPSTIISSAFKRPNVPPGPACDKYPPGVYRDVCKLPFDDPIDNCVRGCLLANWDTIKDKYKNGARPTHCACFALCGMDPGDMFQWGWVCPL
jgi:RHS repeat-associated protein